MKNKLSDLNNHLFVQLERLSDEDLDAERIAQEAERARAIVSVSDQIVGAATLQFKAAELVAKHGAAVQAMIPETVSARMIEHRSGASSETPEQLERRAIEMRRRQRAEAEEAEEQVRAGDAV